MPLRIAPEDRRPSAYCLSYTATELMATPFESVPAWETVRVFPSFETATFAVTTAFPSCFQTFA